MSRTTSVPSFATFGRVVTIPVMEALRNDAVCGKWSDDDLSHYASNIAMANKIAELFIGALPEQVYPLSIDYGRTFAERVEAADYLEVAPGIMRDHISVTEAEECVGKVEVESVLLYFGRRVFSHEVLAVMEWRGLRPATMDELCAFGEQHPDDEHVRRIPALGSYWLNSRGSHCVGYLESVLGDFKLLKSFRFDRQWPLYRKFLAIRK